MKIKLFLILTFLLLTFIIVRNTDAQDSELWKLPEGAKLRLGKGYIREISYSPDGVHIAVASSIGIWFYDVKTGKELDLLTGHTSVVNSIAFSPDGKTMASGCRTVSFNCGMWKRDNTSALSLGLDMESIP